MKKLLSIALIALLLVSCACACEIRLTDGTLKVEASTEIDGEKTPLELKDFHLLGLDGENLILYADMTVYYASQTELEAVVAEAGELEDAASLGKLSKGEKSEAARVFQQQLTDLDYLSGIPDGNYGSGTVAAVKAFQKDTGLPQTGTADAFTQLLLKSMTAEKLDLSLNPDPAARFVAIEGEVDADLALLYELGCRVSYDDITGTGFVSAVKLSCDNNELRELDHAVYTLNFGFEVDGNSRTLTPRIIAECTCLRRPMTNALYIKTDKTRVNTSTEDITGSLSGIKSVEKSVFKPDLSVLNALKDAGDEILVRLQGEYGQIDITLAGEDISKLNAFAAAALSM